MTEHIAPSNRLRLSELALLGLEKANRYEVEAAIDLFAEILRDPEPDEQTKFRADYFPNRPSVILTNNDYWHMAYTIEQDGSISVSRLYLKSNLYQP